MTGIGKWFNDAKGYGFITNEAGGEERIVSFYAGAPAPARS
jgi:cold shock CspA family protein